MSAAAHRSRGLWLAVGVGGLSLLLFLVVLALGLGREPEPSLGADSVSVSALGHTALLALLAEQGVPVTTSRWSTLERLPHDALLVVAEPDALLDEVPGRPAWSSVFARPTRLLLVLPKRAPGAASRRNPRWVRAAPPVERRLLAAVLEPLDLELVPSTLPAREEDLPLGLRGDPEALERLEAEAGARAAQDWRVPEGWPAPDVAAPQLLAQGRGLVPLVACDEGVLVGTLAPPGGPVVTVVSDPDLLSNHGIVRGRNAELTLAILARARGEARTLLWDETFHDRLEQPSLGRLLLRPPLGLLLGSLALLVLGGVWLGAVRFGGPRPPPPVLEAGTAFLVANTADLLRVGGHAGPLLRRYAQEAEREALRRLHLDQRPPAEARAALARLAEARQLPSPEALAREAEALGRRGADPRRLVALAARIHGWREELTHGRPHGS